MSQRRLAPMATGERIVKLRLGSRNSDVLLCLENTRVDTDSQCTVKGLLRVVSCSSALERRMHQSGHRHRACLELDPLFNL